MLASEILSTDFPVLSPGDSLNKAINILHDQSIFHIPIVSDNSLVGLLPVDLLIAQSDHNKPISAFKNDYIHVYAYKDQHGLDIFEMMARHELSSIPVLDENQRYIGSISLNMLIMRLSGYYSFKTVGGIIVLKVGIRDYNLAEISRIAESNNAKILILYIDLMEDNENYKITIKVDTVDLSHILATFERFQYDIQYSYPSTLLKTQLQDRYDFLMKMFDI